MSKHITIIGAGPVGCLLSVYLAKRGHSISIFERRPDMRSNTMSAGRSINLALSDRGLRGLEAAGIVDDILSVAIPMHGRMMHAVDGAQQYQPYGKEGQAINSVSRGGINTALLECADGFEHVNITFNARCTHVDI
ncbi:MAG: FAD-dependent oxidoreductase, partial [Bacteroidota bacterium]